jgi:hypothetical protein
MVSVALADFVASPQAVAVPSAHVLHGNTSPAFVSFRSPFLTAAFLPEKRVALSFNIFVGTAT